jgi:hypothetical protein
LGITGLPDDLIDDDVQLRKKDQINRENVEKMQTVKEI